MKKFIRYMFYIIGGILVVLYLIFRFGMGAMGGMSEEQLTEFFTGATDQPSFHSYEVEGFTMHYADMGADTLPTIIFVHGSPGSWDAYKAYFIDSSLVGKFRMIAVDRIGYGKSSYGQAQSSLPLQGKLIQPLLDLVPADVPLILVGHSYGGPVIYRMAMDYPKQMDGLLVLAGLADPENESRLWIQKPFRSKWLRWLLPPDLDISNREIVPLKEELVEMLPYWNRIQVPTIIIQGQKDMLVKAAHADFAERQLTHIPAIHIQLQEENHFIVWTQQQLIVEQIRELFDQIGDKTSKMDN